MIRFQNTGRLVLAGIFLFTCLHAVASAKLSEEERDRFIWRALNSLSVLGFYEDRCLLQVAKPEKSIDLFLKMATQSGANKEQLEQIKAHYQQGLDFIELYQLTPHLKDPPCEAAIARTYQDGKPLKLIAENDIRTFCDTDEAMALPRKGDDYLKQQEQYRDCAKLKTKKDIMRCLKI
jgi:hypothetical protein